MFPLCVCLVRVLSLTSLEPLRMTKVSHRLLRKSLTVLLSVQESVLCNAVACYIFIVSKPDGTLKKRISIVTLRINAMLSSS